MWSVEKIQTQTDPVEGLVKLAARQHAIERALQDEVLRLRNDGISWTDIGRALDLTRQGARQRYRVAVDEGGSRSC